MSVLTPNMNLIESTVNVDSGLAWENNLNASLTIIDSHDHSSGNGVKITPAGLNINSTVNFQNQQASSVQAVAFQTQSSLATLNSLFVGTDGNLYFNDGAGDASIKMTSGGLVNATSSGISSGAATASFVASVLVVNAASNTPANIQGGSLLLGNNVASSKFLTLSPPNAMAANYALTLPSLPAQTNVMTLSNAGTIASTTYDAVGQAMSATGANAVAASRTRSVSSTVGIGGVAVSATNTGDFTISQTPVDCTNLSVTITTSGRPVNVGLIQTADSSRGSEFFATAQASVITIEADYYLLNGSTVIAQTGVSVKFAANSALYKVVVPANLQCIDFPAAGTYTYKVQFSSPGGTNVTASLQNVALVAYEL